MNFVYTNALRLAALGCLSACSGSGSASDLPSAKAAYVLGAPEIAAASAVRQARTSVVRHPEYPTIQGTVLSNVGTRVVIKLASGKQVAVFTSELRKAKVGYTVAATGYFNSKGNFQAASAQIVTAASPPPQPSPQPSVKPTSRPAPKPSARPSAKPSARPSAKPSARPSARPSPTPSSQPTAIPTSPGQTSAAQIRLHQVFSFRISSAQAAAEGPRYDLVWGASTPTAWRARHPTLLASRYFIMEQSDGAHNLAYYRTYHPDWILYNCTSSGAPTRIPAYMQAGAYGTNVPLDIHNPAVVEFQVRSLAIPPAVAGGYNALAIDQVLFSNIMGGNAGAGSYGCGVYEGNTFVRRYNSRSDSRWASDTVNWIRIAKSIVTSEPHRLKIVVNHPAGSTSSGLEQALLANVDAALSEVGFTNYGGYKRSASLFAVALNYQIYAQAHGVTPLIIDKFVQSAALSPVQREWVVGTYLMANNGTLLLYATNGGYGTGGYGTLHYYPEYGTNMGRACGAVAGGPAIYERRFTNGLVVVNASTSSAVARLPLNHHYTDIISRAVTAVQVVPATEAFVLLTSPGTGCL